MPSHFIFLILIDRKLLNVSCHCNHHLMNLANNFRKFSQRPSRTHPHLVDMSSFSLSPLFCYHSLPNFLRFFIFLFSLFTRFSFNSLLSVLFIIFFSELQLPFHLLPIFTSPPFYSLSWLDSLVISTNITAVHSTMWAVTRPSFRQSQNQLNRPTQPMKVSWLVQS